MSSRRPPEPNPERSDSGPVGPQYREALGLDDEELLDEVWESTKAAIEAAGFHSLKRVDRGGYGVVCRAIDETTGNPRAIKVVLHPEDVGRMAIFRRECRILDAAEMPVGIAPRFYEARESSQVQPFLIQEWIDGQKLGDWLEAHPHLPMNDRESLCRSIFDAYARLHAANLIHRDVSLGNIMITGRKVRLIDFGGGGRANPGYRSLNSMSRVPTTEAFVSTPVRNGERKATIADEVHAVAKVCFTVLTGKIAFEIPSNDWPEVFQQAGVCPQVARFLLPKMQTPPETVAQLSQAREF